MIFSAKVWFSLAFALPLIPGLHLSQLYLQPSKKEGGYFTNDSFFLTCFTTDDSIKLRWIDTDENEITATEGRIHVQPTVGLQKGLELVVESVQKEDAGRYVCSDEQDSISFDLIVYKSISFGLTPKVQHSAEYENGFITCQVTADPSPVVNWYFNGTKLANPEKYKEEENGLFIYNVSREDAGYYKCKAYVITHLSSQVKELDIAFQVQYAPELQESDESVVYASIGSDANITCSAYGNPEPMFQWLKDDEKIHNSSDYMIISNNKETVLRFKVTKKEQFHDYTCRASNNLGWKEKIIELREGNAPQPPTLEVVNEDQGTLTLALKQHEAEDNELHVTGFRVEYIFSSDSWDQANAVEFKKGEEYVIRNMSYNSQYLLRAAARNAAGHGDYSEVVEYLTHTLQVASVVSDKGLSITLSSFAFLLNAVVLWLY